ncbi:hypothetical protein HHI36_017257, partial [Cryptolaemus montrouzieri]
MIITRALVKVSNTQDDLFHITSGIKKETRYLQDANDIGAIARTKVLLLEIVDLIDENSEEMGHKNNVYE